MPIAPDWTRSSRESPFTLRPTLRPGRSANAPGRAVSGSAEANRRSSALGVFAVLVPALVAATALFFFAVRNVHGWTFLPFGDEAGHLLGAIALHKGDVLYRSYIDAHGPVVFMLTQLWGAVSGWHDLTYARAISTVLATLAGTAVVLSPALQGLPARLWAGALFFGLVASAWIVQGLYLDSYHPFAGAFVVIGLALFAAPAWLGRVASLFNAFASGICFALAGFSAYAYGPGVIALAASGVLPLLAARREQQLRGAAVRAVGALALGLATGGLIVLVWLTLFGDVLGFVVYHIIANQIYYARYVWFSFDNFASSFLPPIGPATIVHLIGLVCFLAAFLGFSGMVLTMRRGALRSLLAIALGAGGIALLNARGSTIFQDGAFLMAAIGAAAIALSAGLARLGFAAAPPPVCLATALVAAAVATAELAGRHAVASPSGLARAEIVATPPYHYGPKDDPLYRRIRSIVPPNQRILVLVYNPELYLSAERLPMEKYHDYLPWEADYAKSPWFGRARDLCADLEKSPPPVVYFDNWKVWDAYPPEQFMPCVVRELDEEYRRDPEFPELYVRKDRAAQ